MDFMYLFKTIYILNRRIFTILNFNLTHPLISGNMAKIKSIFNLIRDISKGIKIRYFLIRKYNLAYQIRARFFVRER